MISEHVIGIFVFAFTVLGGLTVSIWIGTWYLNKTNAITKKGE